MSQVGVHRRSRRHRGRRGVRTDSAVACVSAREPKAREREKSLVGLVDRPVAAVRHATAAEAPPTHWAGTQKARAALASATRLMSESDRASFAAYDVEFVVEISRCRAPLHRSTTHPLRPAADVELYSSTALRSALHLYSSTALYTLHPLHTPSLREQQWGSPTTVA